MNRHVDELQTLRGLAALVVAIGHVTLVYSIPSNWRVGLDAILNQHAAVILFFVMSGFVLSASLLKAATRCNALAAYYLRRVFRIYPAIFVVSAFSIVAIATLGDRLLTPAASDWFLGRMTPDLLTASNISLSLLGIRSDLIPPLWTILIELVGSALLPLLVIVAKGRSGYFPALLIALCTLPFFASGKFQAFGYLPFFAFGVGIHLLPAGARKFAYEHGLALIVLASIVLVLFRAAWFFWITGELQPIAANYHDPITGLVEGLASAVLTTAVSAAGGTVPALGHRSLVAFGDISYSFYLIHMPVIAVMSKLLSAPMAWIGAGALTAMTCLLVLALVVTTPLSVFSYRYIEKPGIAAGKRFISGLGMK